MLLIWSSAQNRRRGHATMPPRTARAEALGVMMRAEALGVVMEGPARGVGGPASARAGVGGALFDPLCGAECGF
jgi:hypothetical protein